MQNTVYTRSGGLSMGSSGQRVGWRPFDFGQWLARLNIAHVEISVSAFDVDKLTAVRVSAIKRRRNPNWIDDFDFHGCTPLSAILRFSLSYSVQAFDAAMLRPYSHPPASAAACAAS